jgi:hypothetical protein
LSRENCINAGEYKKQQFQKTGIRIIVVCGNKSICKERKRHKNEGGIILLAFCTGIINIFTNTNLDNLFNWFTKILFQD